MEGQDHLVDSSIVKLRREISLSIYILGEMQNWCRPKCHCVLPNIPNIPLLVLFQIYCYYLEFPYCIPMEKQDGLSQRLRTELKVLLVLTNL